MTPDPKAREAALWLWREKLCWPPAPSLDDLEAVRRSLLVLPDAQLHALGLARRDDRAAYRAGIEAAVLRGCLELEVLTSTIPELNAMNELPRSRRLAIVRAILRALPEPATDAAGREDGGG